MCVYHSLEQLDQKYRVQLKNRVIKGYLVFFQLTANLVKICRYDGLMDSVCAHRMCKRKGCILDVGMAIVLNVVVVMVVVYISVWHKLHEPTLKVHVNRLHIFP